MKISMDCEVLAAYESTADAARREPHHEDMIRKRCKRRSAVDFTATIHYTFRYMDEWQAMTREEQWRDITAKGEVVV